MANEVEHESWECMSQCPAHRAEPVAAPTVGAGVTDRDLEWLREMSRLHGWEVVGRAVVGIESLQAERAALLAEVAEWKDEAIRTANFAAELQQRAELAEANLAGMGAEPDALVAKWREQADRLELCALEADSIGLKGAADFNDARARLLRENADELDAITKEQRSND